MWSLVPTLCVLIIALWTHRTLEALLGGALLGFLIIEPAKFFSLFTASLLKVMSDPTVGWIILVCGLFGSLISMLFKSGGAEAFSALMLRWIKSRRGALLAAWLMGIAIFIDDYLHALTVGSSMKPVTDKFRASREMLAFIVDSTAAPVCVLVPLSTWAVYVAGLMESNGLARPGQGLDFYIRTIPFVIYGWAATLLVPLVIFSVVPLMGPMKRAERRAAKGDLAPPNSEEIALEPAPDQLGRAPRLVYFLLPIAVLIVATACFDMLKGVLSATAFTIALFAATRHMTFAEAMTSATTGFQSMFTALAIIVTSFVLKDVNDQLGLANLVIETASPWMSRALLPAVAFVALAPLTVATGSFWGVYAIATPILVPLALSLNVNPTLAIGAMVSAGAFGSHACFYGDATVLSSAASGCNNMAHALTQLPYALLAATVTAVIYVVLGAIM